MAVNTKPIIVVHITTVPETLLFLRGRAKYFEDHGFKTHTIASPGELLKSFSESEDIDVYPVRMYRRITPFQDLVAILKLRRLIRRIQPSIVHAHTPKAGLLGMLAAQLERVPVRIYHVHGLPFLTEAGLKQRLLFSTEKLSSTLANRVLCVSHSVRNIIVTDGICPPSKIKVIHHGSINGVDADNRFNPDTIDQNLRRKIRNKHSIPNDAFVIGFVGRIVRQKGIIELSESWKYLKSIFPNIYLLMVGPHESKDSIPESINEELNTDSRVRMIGPDWDSPKFFSAFDLVVLPSYREGLPVVLLEAAAMRLPVVASNIPGCVDAVIDGETGTLIPAQDERALARAIQDYIEMPELREHHGNAGRSMVLQDFRPEDIWASTFQEYIQLIEAKQL